MSLRDNERPKPTPSATGLFGWLDALWTKDVPDGTPPTFMLHRFLASDRDYAPVARELQTYVREPALVFKIWQGLLPDGKGAPRLSYVVAKKPPAEEELVARMRAALSESRQTCETMVQLVAAAGRLPDLYAEFGVEFDG